MARRKKSTVSVQPTTAQVTDSAQATESAERKHKRRSKLPVYTAADGSPAQIYVENIEEGGAPPEDFNPDAQRLSKRCYKDLASWWAHCAHNAEQRAIEYRQKAADARQNPEAYKRVSAGKRYRAQIAEQQNTIAQQAQLLQDLQARLAKLEGSN